MDKKQLTISIVVGLLVVTALIGIPRLLPQPDINVTVNIPGNGNLGSFMESNVLEYLNKVSTSTGSYVDGTSPVRILGADANRSYLAISNNSGGEIYITVTSTDYSVDGTGDATLNGGAATSSIPNLSGIIIEDGTTFVWDATDGVPTGYIFASSTGGITKKLIETSYR